MVDKRKVLRGSGKNTRPVENVISEHSIPAYVKDTYIPSKLSDEWQTPDWLFDELNEEFKFDIDLCATENNTKCNLYLNDYLAPRIGQILIQVYGDPNTHDSRDEWLQVCSCAFMNPPYSNPKPFIEKAWKDSRFCRIVCLIKCDPSTKWWGIFWDYENHCPKPGCEVRFFPKRINFDPPLGYEAGLSGPTFPSALVIFDRRGL